MQKIFSRIPHALLLIVLQAGILDCQDSVTAVILSPRVGLRLSAADCRTYRLFTKIPDLESAVFVVLPDSTCGAHVRFAREGSAWRDTMILYSSAAVKRLGERIDHFEDMIEGRYEPGSGRAQLRFVRISRPAEVALFDAAHDASKEKPREIPSPLRAAQPPPQPPQRDLISFAPATRSASLDDREATVYPVIGLGGGVFSYAPDLTSAQQAVDALEAKYNLQGYAIPHWSVASSAKLVTLLSFIYRFSSSVTLGLEGGRAPLGEVTYASASLHYAHDIGLGPRLLGSVGAGWMHLSIGIEHPYNVAVSPPERYLYLDAVRISGGASGALFSAGIEWRPPGGISVTLYGQYLLLPDLRATIENTNEARVTLAGPGVGVKLHLLWR